MLTIGQVAERAGLRASAIRYYEDQGLLPPALRRGGKRVYDAVILERLAVIELAKTVGFEIQEIRVLLTAERDAPRRKWKTLGKAKRAQLDRQMARLALMKTILTQLDRCGCATLDDCGRVFRAACAEAGR